MIFYAIYLASVFAKKEFQHKYHKLISNMDI